MNANKKLFGYTIGFLLVFTACSISGNAGNSNNNRNIETSVAETVAAQAPNNSSSSNDDSQNEVADPPTEAPPTNTPEPTASHTATENPTDANCDNAKYIADITVEDGADFLPGESFTKTWRLKNIGTCTWTSDYDLVFYSGDVLGGPVSTTLTSSSVAPGENVNVSVNLVAPTSEGRYQGFWIFRNNTGQLFGLNEVNPIWVIIEVVIPSTEGGPTATTDVNFTPFAFSTLIFPPLQLASHTPTPTVGFVFPPIIIPTIVFPWP